MSERRNNHGGSYEIVTLRPTNIRYVSSITGYSTTELKRLLQEAAKDGSYEVKIPIGLPIFTRKER